MPTGPSTGADEPSRSTESPPSGQPYSRLTRRARYTAPWAAALIVVGSSGAFLAFHNPPAAAHPQAQTAPTAPTALCGLLSCAVLRSDALSSSPSPSPRASTRTVTAVAPPPGPTPSPAPRPRPTPTPTPEPTPDPTPTGPWPSPDPTHTWPPPPSWPPPDPGWPPPDHHHDDFWSPWW